MTTVQHGSNCDSHSSQDSQRKEPTSDEKARESSSDSDTKDNSPYEWTSMPVKHDEPRRKISCPAYRAGRRESLVAVHANQRRASVAAPRRMNRRGSEAPALTVIARRRNSQTLAYPVGLRKKSLRASGADHHLSIQVKAKHEMLANLVLPTLVEEFPRTRLERRNTFTFQGTTMRTKKDEKRYQVAKEILDTEKKYLACLRTLKEVFEKPIRENNLISPKEIDVLFPGELDQILKSHTLFMNDLEERLQNWKLQGIVGDIFTKLSGSYHIDVLRIYSNYVNNFPKAIGVINKASRGSHKFRKYLQHCSSNSECEGLDLPAFLLTPIQRLPRYVLLLRQLSKYTDPGHPDSFHIENALETMKQMINILNDSIQSSCKLASNSHMRRSFRRKPPKKKGKELQRSRYNSQESDRVSVGHGSISALSVESFGPGSTCSQDTSPEREAANLEERGSPTMLLESEEGRKGLDRRSRPASSGEMETSFERDTQEEFETIKEEDSGNLEDNKSPGQNVFRMAADTLKRNWQRRSKKWRRSTEEPIKRENVDDMETTVKNNDVNQEHMDEPIIALNQEIFEDENANVDLDVKSYTPPCSPATRNMKKSDGSFSPKPRPVSLGFPTGFQLRSEQQNVLKDKVLSDPSLTKEKSIENCSDVWIPRQNLPLTRRRISRQSVCSRNSSVFSGDTSPLSGSKKSLSQISQESLADSGVSETPGHSPSNTLTSRTRKWSTPERGEKLSQSLTNVSASGDSKRKLSQLNRRSWGDWISAEMENNNDEETVDRDEDRVDDAGVKNKRKFKDVMKQLFFKKKHTSTIASPSKTVPRGVIYCCVPLCHSYSGKVVNGKVVKLHRLPKDTKTRRIWIARLRNVRQNFSAKSGTRVCSLHFKGEEGPKPWCQFPSLFPSKPVQESLLRRNRPLPNRSRGSTTSSKVQTCQELAECSSSTKQAVCNGNNFHHCFHDYISTRSCNFDPGGISEDGSRDKGIQFCSNSTNSGVQATVEMKDFVVQVNLPLLTAEDLKGDDLKTRFYTGFVNFGTFMVIFNSLSLITGKLNYWNGKDSLKEKEYLENDVKQKPGPQRKMRLEQDLAQRFCVSVSTVSRVLITWYNMLAANLKHLIVWPSKQVIATNMPDCLKKFPNTRIIKDCTELFIEIPSSLVNQTITYSSYKSHNTFKLLVGISPTGVVTFLSKLWGGNASDK